VTFFKFGLFLSKRWSIKGTLFWLFDSDFHAFQQIITHIFFHLITYLTPSSPDWFMTAFMTEQVRNFENILPHVRCFAIWISW